MYLNALRLPNYTLVREDEASYDTGSSSADRGDEFVWPASAKPASMEDEDTADTPTTDDDADKPEPEAETTPDEDETPDLDTDEDGDSDQPQSGNPKSTHVPYARFKQTNERRRQAEEELIRLQERNRLLQEQLERSQPTANKDKAPEVFDFEAAESLYHDAVLLGDRNEAIRIRNQIRAEETKVLREQLQREQQEVLATSVSQQSIEQKATQLMQMYPNLDENAAEYDPDALQEAVIWVRGASTSPAHQDKTPLQLMEMAAKRFGKARNSEAAAPAVDVDAVRENRKKEAIDKRVNAKQPAQVKKGSVAGERVDYTIHSPRDLDSIDPQKLAQLRGDFI